MKSMTVRKLIDILNNSLEDGSIDEHDSVTFYGCVNHIDGGYFYTFELDFKWDTVDED